MREHMTDTIGAATLGDYWPGIQLYYPPVKYAPSLGIYEDMAQASARMKKHAHFTNAHTLIFDLEDGCRQKQMSRELLRQELPGLRKINQYVTVALRVNSFRTAEYDLQGRAHFNKTNGRDRGSRSTPHYTTRTAQPRAKSGWGGQSSAKYMKGRHVVRVGIHCALRRWVC